MKRFTPRMPAFSVIIWLTLSCAQAQPSLLAVGTLTHSRAGADADLSGLNYKLENGVAANLLGGLGSALTYASGNTFLALPDRGPNAAPYNPPLTTPPATLTGSTLSPWISIRTRAARPCRLR